MSRLSPCIVWRLLGIAAFGLVLAPSTIITMANILHQYNDGYTHLVNAIC